ncbi:MAG TPA: NAD(P)-binding domain-containing protein [Amaricoccus sp.]|uniref:NAD(P)-binding domain-containing protein n=1 Tax=Amaricoccus sp. TaxID=1872485 RepID=UPI002C2195E8|nr:NAD(P)-binding domain-containing protein [Amaricoccus sp.]HMQ92836.1 NAD(P)-binding domain-containing protein [Amaricoccus sp.]HMR52858.1 NAD(P)-binding domain-containing protein [Amaricoccus sp.]HMR60378.1 NAD(P)-binding domain-containing protein [Amaricoccus sp.]HMT99793.1 NAD(P)-binding domain-containing protein [Amaricoccus sp.]
MKRVTTIVVGAGQCGLAMSHALRRHSVDHLVLERGRIANSWRTERWDGLRLLTPNWMNGLAGRPYRGPDPDSFMTCGEFAEDLTRAAALDGAPVLQETRVLALDPLGGGYRVQTDQGAIACDSVVIASGECALPRIPGLAGDLPPGVLQLTPQSYKRPADVPEGGVLVVGAGASGLQIARELALAGRRVTLAVGNHLRLPRRYRGADILWWMHRLGVLDLPPSGEDELDRLRRAPSLPLLGDPSHADIDLNGLQDLGIEIVGRLAGLTEGKAWFSGSLANACASADLKLARLLDRIDAHADRAGIDAPPACRLPATRIPEAPRLMLRLGEGGIGTVVWATGYRPDHRWVKLPVFDGKGRIRHDGGVVGEGIYVLGLRHLRSARSTHIAGAPRDARVLARHLTDRLGGRAAA